MKTRKAIFFIVAALSVLIQLALTIVNSNGIACYTNAPGETTCTTCHVTYPLNSPGGSIKINLQGCTNAVYIPGQTYTVEVQIVKPGAMLFGFDFEALDTMGNNAGTISITDPVHTILRYAVINGSNRCNITHYGGTAVNDSCTFTFRWVAPSRGNVFLYAAGNAANGDGYTYGDYIYTDSLFLSPAISTDIQAIAPDRHPSVAPNPAEKEINISYFTSGRTIVEARLVSSGGQAFPLFNTEEQSAGEHQKRMNLPPNLPSGEYVLLVTEGGQTASRKIIIR